MKSVLITGVSSGIGYGLAKAFVARGYRVYGSVRKESDGKRVKEALGDRVVPLLFDVTDREAIKKAVEIVDADLHDVGLAALFNNAGINVAGPLMYQDLDEVRRQFEVNVIGLLAVTQAFLPLLGARKDARFPPGKIFNVSSVGGKLAAPFIGAYAASKHAVEGISESLRRELLLYGIDVIILGPGAVKSDIWGKSELTEDNPYLATEFGPAMRAMQKFADKQAASGFTVDEFGEMVLRIFEQKKHKTRYSLVPQKFMNWTVPMLLPRRAVDGALAKELGLKKVGG